MGRPRHPPITSCLSSAQKTLHVLISELAAPERACRGGGVGWGGIENKQKSSRRREVTSKVHCPQRKWFFFLFALWYPLQPQCKGKPLFFFFFVRSESEFKRRSTWRLRAIESAWRGYLPSISLKRRRENRIRSSLSSIHDKLSKSYLWADYSEGHPSPIKPNLSTVRNCLRKKIPLCSVSAVSWRRATTSDDSDQTQKCQTWMF